jgi:hypothetical protein
MLEHNQSLGIHQAAAGAAIKLKHANKSFPQQVLVSGRKSSLVRKMRVNKSVQAKPIWSRVLATHRLVAPTLFLRLFLGRDGTTRDGVMIDRDWINRTCEAELNRTSVTRPQLANLSSSDLPVDITAPNVRTSK